MKNRASNRHFYFGQLLCSLFGIRLGLFCYFSWAPSSTRWPLCIQKHVNPFFLHCWDLNNCLYCLLFDTGLLESPSVLNTAKIIIDWWNLSISQMPCCCVPQHCLHLFTEKQINFKRKRWSILVWLNNSQFLNIMENIFSSMKIIMTSESIIESF